MSPARCRRAMASRRRADAGQQHVRAARDLRAGSLVTWRSAPRRSSAIRTEAMLAPPVSMITTSACSQHALGARQVAALAADGLAQRAADALEAGLDHVVRVLAAHAQVQVAAERRRTASGRNAAPARSAVRRPRSRGKCPSNTKYGRPDRSIATCACAFVHRQQEAVAADAALVAECAAASASPSASAQSSTVWCSSMCRSPGSSSCEREAAMLGELLEHVVEEAEAGVHADRAVAVQVDARRGCRSRVCGARSRAAGEQFAHDGGPGLGQLAVSAHAQTRGCRGCARTRCPCPDRRSRRCGRDRTGGRGEVVAQQAASAACGSRSHRPGSAGRCRSRRNGCPARRTPSTMNCWQRSKCSRGKLRVPRPSWLVTITRRIAGRRELAAAAANTPGTKRIFSSRSTCSSGGSSISVPSRSMNSVGSGACSCQGSAAGARSARRADGDAQSVLQPGERRTSRTIRPAACVRSRARAGSSNSDQQEIGVAGPHLQDTRRARERRGDACALGNDAGDALARTAAVPRARAHVPPPRRQLGQRRRAG